MTISKQELNRVWQEADCLCGEEEVEASIVTVAQQMNERLADENPILLCVMNGGMVFCGKLMLRLNFPLQVDYIHVSRYRGDVVGQENIHWLVSPQSELDGRHVIIVDDIYDEGATLVEIVNACKQKGASKVSTAVLVDKKHDRKTHPHFVVDFIGLEVADRYLFGYGMDYKSYFRNAPGIYAVKGL